MQVNTLNHQWTKTPGDAETLSGGRDLSSDSTAVGEGYKRERESHGGKNRDGNKCGTEKPSGLGGT